MTLINETSDLELVLLSLNLGVSLSSHNSLQVKSPLRLTNMLSSSYIIKPIKIPPRSAPLIRFILEITQTFSLLCVAVLRYKLLLEAANNLSVAFFRLRCVCM